MISLALLGIIPLVGRSRKHPWTVSIAILGNLVAALLFLCLAKAYFGPRDSRAHLERFVGLAVIPLAVLLGIGAHSLRHYLQMATGNRFPEQLRKFGVAVFVGVLVLTSWEFADGSNRRISELFREALALDLPSNAAYVSFSDMECDYGVPSENGSASRFRRGTSEANGIESALPPRSSLRLAGLGPYTTMPELIKLAHEKGILVASS